MAMTTTKLQRIRRRRITALAALALVAVTAGLIVGASRDDPEPEPPASKEREAAPPAKQLPVEQAVGQLLVMSFDGTTAPDYIRRRLRDGQGTGVILFAKNAPDSATLKTLTRTLQRAADGSALIATDQEGGQIRSVPFAPPEQSQATLANPAAAAGAAKAAGTDLAANGINVNLAPVADIGSGIGSVMAGRAYPGDAEQVSGLVKAAVPAYGRRVAATAKHFPGLGRAAANTDDEPVTIDASRRELAGDLEPFEAAIDQEVPLVMSSHALYSALDGEDIASQSRPILTGLLRDELGFKGAIVTDSIEAQAVLSRSGIAEAAERSIDAGTDLILMTGSGSWNEIQPRLLRRARTDAAFRARVRRAAARVIALKRRLGLTSQPPAAGR